MDAQPSFEHALEADMRTLATEVRRRQESADTHHEGLDTVKEAIRSFPKLEHGSAENGVPASPAAASSTSPLPAYADDAAPEVKLEIEYLLDLAFQKGIATALAQSEKSPYFVQDAFHDALAGKLYPELQKRGAIK